MDQFMTNLENEIKQIFTNTIKGGNSKTTGGDNQENIKTDDNNKLVQPVNPLLPVQGGKSE